MKCINSEILESYDNYEQLAQQARAAGYDGLELALNKIPRDAQGQLDIETDSLIAQALQSSVPIGSITTSTFDLFSLAQSDTQTRSEAAAYFDALLHWAAAYQKRRTQADLEPVVVIGAHQLVQPANCRVSSYEQSLNNVFTALGQLVTTAEQLSVRLTIENPAAGLFLSPLELRDIIDQFNSPYVGVCFNPLYAIELGNSLDWLAIFGRRSMALRLPVPSATNIDKDTPWQEIITTFQQHRQNGPIVYRKFGVNKREVPTLK